MKVKKSIVTHQLIKQAVEDFYNMGKSVDVLPPQVVFARPLIGERFSIYETDFKDDDLAAYGTDDYGGKKIN